MEKLLVLPTKDKLSEILIKKANRTKIEWINHSYCDTYLNYFEEIRKVEQVLYDNLSNKSFWQKIFKERYLNKIQLQDNILYLAMRSFVSILSENHKKRIESIAKEIFKDMFVGEDFILPKEFEDMELSIYAPEQYIGGIIFSRGITVRLVYYTPTKWGGRETHDICFTFVDFLNKEIDVNIKKKNDSSEYIIEQIRKNVFIGNSFKIKEDVGV